MDLYLTELKMPTLVGIFVCIYREIAAVAAPGLFHAGRLTGGGAAS
jgi:hypothetical protein